jgi:hypothetical protein
MTKAGKAAAHRSIANFVRALASDLFGTYRPERHYMRGPGPKWHEMHARQQSASVAIPMHHAKAA